MAVAHFCATVLISSGKWVGIDCVVFPTHIFGEFSRRLLHFCVLPFWPQAAPPLRYVCTCTYFTVQKCFVCLHGSEVLCLSPRIPQQPLLLLPTYSSLLISKHIASFLVEIHMYIAFPTLCLSSGRKKQISWTLLHSD